MDVLAAECDQMEAATAGGGSPAAPPRGVAEEPEPARVVLRIYARDGDRKIKLISDGTPVPEAERQAESAFFESQAEADAVAACCAGYLERAAGMACDAEGWHRVPAEPPLAQLLPTLLKVARNGVWAAVEPQSDPLPPAPAASTFLTVVASCARQHWSLRKVAWFGFLVGLGWSAKRIAQDELIRSTANNVYRQAHRFGLSLSATPQGQVCLDLPLATLAVIDRAAAAAHLQRDAFVKRLLIRAAKDPARFGLTVVST